MLDPASQGWALFLINALERMELILKGSNIHLRLSKAEVDQIISGYEIQETVYFGQETTFNYLLTSIDSADLTATFEKSTIKIGVSGKKLKQWCENENDTVLERVIDHAEGTSLFIKIEKEENLIRNDPDKSF